MAWRLSRRPLLAAILGALLAVSGSTPAEAALPGRARPTASCSQIDTLVRQMKKKGCTEEIELACDASGSITDPSNTPAPTDGPGGGSTDSGVSTGTGGSTETSGSTAPAGSTATGGSTVPAGSTGTTGSTGAGSSNIMQRRVAYIGHLTTDIEKAIRGLVDNEYTHIVLGFYLWMHKISSQMDLYWDAAEKWMNLSEAKRKEIVAYAHSKKAYILLSAGGGTEDHSGFANNGVRSGTAWGKNAAEKAIKAGVDGLDIDSESWTSNDFKTGVAIKWLIDATTAAREVLGSRGIISHAPQAPYFSSAPVTNWAGDGYKAIHKAVGDKIDFYFVQFYNQGGQYPHHDADAVLYKMGGWAAGASLKGIKEDGVDLNKIVIGKYTHKGKNGSDGYMTPQETRDMCCKANKDPLFNGWNGGSGVWVYTDDDAEETFEFGRQLAKSC